MHTTAKPTFGKRGSGRAGTLSPAPAGFRHHRAAPRAEQFRYQSDADQALATHVATEATAERFVAKFNLWLTCVAVGVLIPAVNDIYKALFPDPEQSHGLHVIPLTNFDNEMFFFAYVLTAAIGLAWCIKSLFGREALVLTDSHISGFTLFGTKTIRWQDISHARHTKHETYGTEIQIHATRGTPSSSIWLNCIPLYVGLTDKSPEEVMAAIRVYRPDL